MKTEEIEEENKLITEFMEWHPETLSLLKKPVLQYHSSWDWLITVLEKIESLGYSVCMESRRNVKHRCVIFKSPLLIDKGDESAPWIDSAWKAVVEFIKWYNKQTHEKP